MMAFFKRFNECDMRDKKLLIIAVIILLLVSVGVYMFLFPREIYPEDHPYMIEDQDLQDMNNNLEAHYASANDYDSKELEKDRDTWEKLDIED